MKNIFLLLSALTILTIKNQAQTVTDYDGNVYNTIVIGSQTWMKENLKVTHYRNGNPIPNVTDNSIWNSQTTAAFCFYNNDSIINKTTYGALYNWYTVNDSNLCPIGWHIPSDSEWTILTNYLGGISIAGGKMKETGTTHWLSPNTGATNSSGFTGLPGGERIDFGSFGMMNSFGVWWTSTETSIGYAWRRLLAYDYADISPSTQTKKNGLSVRCIKDNSNGIYDINYFEKIIIYPNPAINKITINYNDKLKIQVYNIIGNCVLQKELCNGTNDIDICSLSKGVYVIQITSANWTEQKKLIKE